MALGMSELETAACHAFADARGKPALPLRLPNA